MRAGRLRHRITIEQNTPTRDSFGTEVEAWSTLATVWSRHEVLSGGETIVQRQAGASLNHRFTIRRRTDVTPAMRVSWSGRYFDIAAVLGDGVTFTQLICTESV